jgi:hypothetical protein
MFLDSLSQSSPCFMWIVNLIWLPPQVNIPYIVTYFTGKFVLVKTKYDHHNMRWFYIGTYQENVENV